MKRRGYRRVKAIPEARRNSVSFEPAQHRWLLEQAAALDVPISEILRRCVESVRLSVIPATQSLEAISRM